MPTLGQNIKKARIDLGWRQLHLVAHSGLSQRYLSDIENDKVDPRLSVLKRLAEVLGVTIDTLAYGDKP